MGFLSTVLLALSSTIGGSRAEKPPVGLRPLDFEAAQATARIERRPVMLLLCTGEAECKRVALDMLKEIKLRQWFDEKVVAIQVDRNANVAIADRYRVRKTPTYLFVDAKGTEMDRIVGMKDSKTLRAEGDEILKGGDPMERLQKKRKGREADPEMRLRYADILCDRGDLDTALDEYLAVHQQGGAMGDEAFEELLRLARIYPKAADTIGGLAAALEPRIVAAEASDEEFARWLYLCSKLKLDTRRLGVHDTLAQFEGEQEERADELRNRIAPTLRDLFYTDRRYEDLSDLVVDARADFEARRAAHTKTASLGNEPETKRSLRLVREDTARDFEALIGVKRFSEATLLADALIGFDTSIATYEALVEVALRAENRAEAKLIAQRGRTDVRLDPKARMRIAPMFPLAPK